MDRFTWIPDFDSEHEEEMSVEIQSSESGYEQRRCLSDTPNQVHKLRFSNRHKEELLEVRAFWRAQKGATIPFLYKPLNSDNDVVVRFKNEALKSSPISHKIYNFSVTLVVVK